jgi:hypothetical protein
MARRRYPRLRVGEQARAISLATSHLISVGLTLEPAVTVRVVTRRGQLRRPGEPSVAQPAREPGAPRWRTVWQVGGDLTAPDPRPLAAWLPVLLHGHAAKRIQRAGRTPTQR